MMTVTIDEQTSQSLRELAERLQKNPEEVIELLVREKLEHDERQVSNEQATRGPARSTRVDLSPEELVKRWMKLTEGFGDRVKEPWKSTPHGDLLYDDLGLPK
jgi:hypothetical protein